MKPESISIAGNNSTQSGVGKKFLIIGVGINTNFSPIVKRFKSTSLHNIGKKNINNNQILKDIKKVYENFINDIKKYTFLELKKKLVKSK